VEVRHVIERAGQLVAPETSDVQDRLQRSHFDRAAGPVQKGAVADLDIFNGMAGNAATGASEP
jgi:hypothetical protein